MSTYDPFGTVWHRRRTAAVAALTVALAALAVTGVPAAAASSQQGSTPSFVVELAQDGSAEVTLTLTYDLETDDERTAFGTLQNDTDARADARDRFRGRMASVASDASATTGRDMTVKDAAIDLAVTDGGNLGVVRLSVTWTNLAAHDGNRLVVTEPFASGFQPEQTFEVSAPDGYQLAGASPSPDSESANAATWSAGTNLTGFEAAFAPTSGGDDGSGGGTDGIGAPGFGVGAGLLALAAALGLLRRRA